MKDIAPLDWRYLLRLVLGLVFLWAALAKIGDLRGFAGEIHNYRAVAISTENLFAMTIPWVELVAGLALLINVFPRGATLTLGGLLLVFFVLILSAIVRGLDVECGCFGTSDAARTDWLTLLRDTVFLLLAWFGYPRRKASPQVASGAKAR